MALARERVITPGGDTACQYRRDVGTTGVVFLVVNGMIGSGIFGLPELLHDAVGTFAPWLLLAGGLLMSSVFLCFADLGRLTDRSGGPQRFVTDAFGHFAGFQVGWLYYFGRMVAHAANVTVLIAYVAALWAPIGVGAQRSFAVTLIIAAVIVSVLGNSVAGHTTARRMTASLSNDGLIPDWFGSVSRWGTPANSIVFFGVGALMFALSGTFVTLAVSGTLARLLVYIASIGALPLLRKSVGLKALSLPTGIAAFVALLLCSWASFQSSRQQWALMAAFLSVGTILFFVARYSRSAASKLQS